MGKVLCKGFGVKCNNFKKAHQKEKNGRPRLDKGKTIVYYKGFGHKHNNFKRVSQKEKNGGFMSHKGKTINHK